MSKIYEILDKILGELAKNSNQISVKYVLHPSRTWAVGTTWVSSLNWVPQADEGYEIIGVVGASANNNGVLMCNLTYSQSNGKTMGSVYNLYNSTITDSIGVYYLERKIG